MNIKLEANKRNYILNANQVSSSTEETISYNETRGTTDGDIRVLDNGDIRIVLLTSQGYPATVSANKRNYTLNAPLIKVQ